MTNVFALADRARKLLAKLASQGTRIIYGRELAAQLGLTKRESQEVWAHLVETQWLKPINREDWESASEPVFEINFLLAEPLWRAMGWRSKLATWARPLIAPAAGLIRHFLGWG